MDGAEDGGVVLHCQHRYVIVEGRIIRSVRDGPGEGVRFVVHESGTAHHVKLVFEKMELPECDASGGRDEGRHPFEFCMVCVDEEARVCQAGSQEESRRDDCEILALRRRIVALRWVSFRLQ